ncbi:NAD-dependent epimerase/dehydratase family protein [Hymenobacter jejuensis]|uniref:NAD-dependent epimerase/dehydratase family protein n=1 Tax=Hymenobacter jejuensis TaxID=2502781 RepID=A0A5B8A109_9BACT|nr:NAD-dependent epimerase/dehydratase family protein [Hymenobacter jejuensis]QDA61000.1 NAD-dependent epimerase/dehydratase family protein [Hymenobacter jejuensis]
MQTILGAGGAIGTELARELRHYTDRVRLVGRKPVAVNPTDELFSADLTNAAQVERAVAGSDVVYLTVGYEYNRRVWRAKWPATMRNVLDACQKHQAKLVFFDNVYMYDRAYIAHMTEETPVRPTSKKGEIRAQIAQMLLSAAQSGQVQALIARSADFLGLKNSVLVETVYKNLSKGKRADWLANADKIHNWTNVLDAAKATALLGNTPDAYNQVWHLPTDKAPITGRQWVEMFAQEMHVAPRFRVVPLWLMSLLGLFVPVMRELREMAYQYSQDYFFDSSKFEKRFGYTPISAREGVRQIVTSGKQGAGN